MRIGPTAAPSPAAGSAVRPAPSVPLAAPTLVRPAAATAARPTAAAAERRAAAPTIPPSPRPKPGPAAAPSEASRQTWLDRAERDRKRYGKARFAIQLELACEVPSLVEAFQHDRPAGSMWLLATPFQGRTCFRVLWGRYNSRQEAARGLTRAPAFFSTAQNHPAVVPLR
jgi:septal ring-binding cell division protein DamX